MPNQPPNSIGFWATAIPSSFRIFSAKRGMTPQLHRRLTKIVAFLTAMRGSALIMVSGEQVGSTEKWTAPAAEARKKNPVAVTESSLTAGQKIYLQRCFT